MTLRESDIVKKKKTLKTDIKKQTIRFSLKNTSEHKTCQNKITLILFNSVFYFSVPIKCLSPRVSKPMIPFSVQVLFSKPNFIFDGKI